MLRRPSTDELPRNDREGGIASRFILSLRAEGVAISAWYGIAELVPSIKRGISLRDCFGTDVPRNDVRGPLR